MSSDTSSIDRCTGSFCRRLNDTSPNSNPSTQTPMPPDQQRPRVVAEKADLPQVGQDQAGFAACRMNGRRRPAAASMLPRLRREHDEQTAARTTSS